MTSSSMQIMGYCEQHVLDQAVVMMGCRVNGEHPESSMEWTGAPVLDETLQSV